MTTIAATGLFDRPVAREHWTVPVHGLTPADPDGTVQALADRDGTVIVTATCGHTQTLMRLDVSKAAQLSTGIWEAAGTALQLTGHPDENQPPLHQPQPLSGPGDPPPSWPAQPPRRTPAHNRTPRGPRRLPPVDQDAAKEARRELGLRLRRIRHARKKSLQTISGLAGMNIATLHHIEYGRRDLTLFEVAALANALQTDPVKLIVLPRITATSR